MSAVPRDPRELSAFLSATAARHREDGPASLVGDVFTSDALTLWRHPRAPADLRAALVRVLAATAGAHSLGDIRDSAGRTARAIQLPAAGGSLDVAYDPATSRLLAEGAKAENGRLRWSMTHAVGAAAVAAVGDRP